MVRYVQAGKDSSVETVEVYFTAEELAAGHGLKFGSGSGGMVSKTKSTSNLVITSVAAGSIAHHRGVRRNFTVTAVKVRLEAASRFVGQPF